MEGPFLCDRLFEKLAPIDVFHMLGSSRTVREIGGPAAIAATFFALTRPGVNYAKPGAGAEEASVATWMRVWMACSAAVEAKGHDSSVWAYSVLASLYDLRGNDDGNPITHMFNAKLTDHFLVSTIGFVNKLVHEELGKTEAPTAIGLLALNVHAVNISNPGVCMRLQREIKINDLKAASRLQHEINNLQAASHDPDEDLFDNVSCGVLALLSDGRFFAVVFDLDCDGGLLTSGTCMGYTLEEIPCWFVRGGRFEVKYRICDGLNSYPIYWNCSFSGKVYKDFEVYLRLARDGNAYTYEEFWVWYNGENGEWSTEADSDDEWFDALPLEHSVNPLARILNGLAGAGPAGPLNGDASQCSLADACSRLRGHDAGGADDAATKLDSLHLNAAVVEAVVHEELAATRDEGLLRLQAEHDWADQVIEFLHDPDVMIRDSVVEDSGVSESVYTLRFGSGDTEEFRNILLSGPQLRPCREALWACGHSCEHHSGALLFVKPHQIVDVLHTLDSVHGLRPYHIVITDSFEYLLDEVLTHMSCRSRPREKHGSRCRIMCVCEEDDVVPKPCEPDDSEHRMPEDTESCSMDVRDGNDLDLFVQRTFLCVAPRLHDANTVIQSTTEATANQSANHYAHRRGINPRRVV